MLNNEEINEIFRCFSEKNAEPKIELNYRNHFTLVVAVILSAQSMDKVVNKITAKLFVEADTPLKMVELGEEKLKNYIKQIGLYNSKARNIIAASKALIEQFSGIVPRDFEQLQKLPGIGPKSANVILNSLFGEPRIAVDTHVFRVSNRIGLCKSKTTFSTGAILHIVIPKIWQKNAHHWLVSHGRYVCKAKKPKCGECIISDICQYEAKNIAK